MTLKASGGPEVRLSGSLVERKDFPTSGLLDFRTDQVDFRTSGRPDFGTPLGRTTDVEHQVFESRDVLERLWLDSVWLDNEVMPLCCQLHARRR